MTSKCGENQQQNEQNLVTTSGALKRSNSTATKKQVASNEGELHKQMDKQKKVHRAQLLDKQNEVAQAHRQTERRQ